MSQECIMACNAEVFGSFLTIFDLIGNKLKQIKTSSPIQPIYITVNSRGCVIISDWLANCIRITDGAGRIKHTYCPDIATPFAECNLWYPGSLAVDKIDRIYVSDHYDKKITVLTQSGKFLHELNVGMQTIGRPRSLTVNNDTLFVAGTKEFVSMYQIGDI